MLCCYAFLAEWELCICLYSVPMNCKSILLISCLSKVWYWKIGKITRLSSEWGCMKYHREPNLRSDSLLWFCLTFLIVWYMDARVQYICGRVCVVYLVLSKNLFPSYFFPWRVASLLTKTHNLHCHHRTSIGFVCIWSPINNYVILASSLSGWSKAGCF